MPEDKAESHPRQDSANGEKPGCDSATVAMLRNADNSDFEGNNAFVAVNCAPIE